MELALKSWNRESYLSYVNYLKSLVDEKYREFHSGLVPGKENILGIRMPILRATAKEVVKGNWREFLELCTSDTYEEVLIKGIVIGLVPVDYEEFIGLVDGFAPLVDNWATCDSFCNGLKRIKAFKEGFFEHLEDYLCSENPWYIRIALVTMLSFYVEEGFINKVIHRSAAVKSQEYYVRMANAWLVAECYIRFPIITQDFLIEQCPLDNWTYNKAIQKIRESYRISKETKNYLKTLKRR